MLAKEPAGKGWGPGEAASGQGLPSTLHLSKPLPRVPAASLGRQLRRRGRNLDDARGLPGSGSFPGLSAGCGECLGEAEGSARGAKQGGSEVRSPARWRGGGPVPPVRSQERTHGLLPVLPPASSLPRSSPPIALGRKHQTRLTRGLGCRKTSPLSACDWESSPSNPRTSFRALPQARLRPVPELWAPVTDSIFSDVREEHNLSRRPS